MCKLGVHSVSGTLCVEGGRVGEKGGGVGQFSLCLHVHE
jgi:hypothetical protein